MSTQNMYFTFLLHNKHPLPCVSVRGCVCVCVCVGVNGLPIETSSCYLSSLSSHQATMETKCHCVIVTVKHLQTTAHPQHSWFARGRHTDINFTTAVHKHTNPVFCTIGNLLSLSGPAGVGEYNEDQSLIRCTAGGLQCFLCQQIKCETNMNRITESFTAFDFQLVVCI